MQCFEGWICIGFVICTQASTIESMQEILNFTEACTIESMQEILNLTEACTIESLIFYFQRRIAFTHLRIYASEYP